MANLEVRCYSGHIYAERPVSFRYEDREYDIEEIEREWLEPGERHFQVRTRDNKSGQLCYNEVTKEWSLTRLERSRNAERDSQNTGK